MSRWARKTDSNQSDIIKALESVGCTVLDLSRVGQGCPDILVGRADRCYLLEIKSPKGKLNKAQRKFRDTWRGSFAVVRSGQQALEAVGVINV